MEKSRIYIIVSILLFITTMILLEYNLIHLTRNGESIILFLSFLSIFIINSINIFTLEKPNKDRLISKIIIILSILFITFGFPWYFIIIGSFIDLFEGSLESISIYYYLPVFYTLSFLTSLIILTFYDKNYSNLKKITLILCEIIISLGLRLITKYSFSVM